jgi:homoserine kinase type II
MKQGSSCSAEESLLRRILEHYDLGRLLIYRRAETGHVYENWFLTTTQGRYFLKRRHTGLSHPDVILDPHIIRPQHELVVLLHQARFPTPALVPTTKGQTLLLMGPECVEVQEYIEGGPYDHSRPAHMDEAAAKLARYHGLVASLVKKPLCDRGTLYAPPRILEHLSRLSVAWCLSAAHGVVDMVQRLEDHAADLHDRFARHGSLPHLVIHGDYYAGNLLFIGDRITGVLDYDRARWQPRVVELAEALIYFSSDRQGPLRHQIYPSVLRWEPFARFLRSYGRVLPLPDDRELAALPDYVRCIWLQMALQRLLEARLSAKRAAGKVPALRHTGGRTAEPGVVLQELLVLADWARANGARMVDRVQSVSSALSG